MNNPADRFDANGRSTLHNRSVSNLVNVSFAGYTEGASPVQTATMEYYDRIDLETGFIDTDCDFLICEDDLDFWFAFNALRSNPAVLFQVQFCPNGGFQPEIAFLDSVPFDLVADADIDSLVFTTSLVDSPLDNDDTVVLRTCDGNFFKIGNAECNTGQPDVYTECLSPNTPEWTVRFDYELLRTAP